MEPKAECWVSGQIISESLGDNPLTNGEGRPRGTRGLYWRGTQDSAALRPGLSSHALRALVRGCDDTCCGRWFAAVITRPVGSGSWLGAATLNARKSAAIHPPTYPHNTAPPLMFSTSPVIWRAQSEPRKTMALATSSAVARRFSGMASIARRFSSFSSAVKTT